MNRSTSAWIFGASAACVAAGATELLRSPARAQGADAPMVTVESRPETTAEPAVEPEVDVVLVSLPGATDQEAPAAARDERSPSPSLGASVAAEKAAASMAGPAADTAAEAAAPPAASRPKEAEAKLQSPVPAAHLRHPQIPRTIRRVDEAKQRALVWLVKKQSPDGSWLGPPRSAAGEEQPEKADAMRVRVTSLALYALTSNGHAEAGAKFSSALDRSMAWLLEQQDAESGCIGKRPGPGGTLDHALALYALGELHMRRPTERGAAALELALAYLEGAAPTVAAQQDASAPHAPSAPWLAATSDLRALFDPTTRAEQLTQRENFMNWRYLMYTSFSDENGAHDGFATLTIPKDRQLPPEKISSWLEQALDESIKRDDSGAFESSSSHHEDLGNHGVTALFCIALGIARESLL